MKKHELNKILSKIKRINLIEIKEKIDDHYRYTILHGGKVIMRTKLSHGSKEKSGDVKNIAKDLHFRVDELKPYARCTITNDEYFENLEAKNLIP